MSIFGYDTKTKFVEKVNLTKEKPLFYKNKSYNNNIISYIEISLRTFTVSDSLVRYFILRLVKLSVNEQGKP